VATRKISEQYSAADRSKGLFRALIAGTGHTLVDAFAKLEHSPSAERMARHPCRNLLGARIALTPEEGEGYWDFTQIANDVYVIVANFAYKDPRVEFVPGDGLIQFHFNLSGDLTLAVSRTEPLRINRPGLVVYSQPQGVDIHEWTAPSAHERFVVVTLRPQFLVDHFCGSSVEVPPKLEAFVAGTRGKIEYCHLPLNAQMFELGNKLVNNLYVGTLGLVYTEAVALELLCVAIAGFNSLSSLPNEQYTEREFRCLHAARSMLMKQLTPAPTIRLVARGIGMNETTLKRGFKAVFGETIFDFSMRCRMQHALRLLRDERTQVARVAEAVGYRHQTSFATAFRRHFGVRPKDVRRGPRA
jgi:AraC-like DNA-binding protein